MHIPCNLLQLTPQVSHEIITLLMYTFRLIFWHILPWILAAVWIVAGINQRTFQHVVADLIQILAIAVAVVAAATIALIPVVIWPIMRDDYTQCVLEHCPCSFRGEL